MRKEGVVHMPSSLGCRVSHSSVVTVETIAFIKNKQWILVARPLYRKEYFHSPTCGTSTILFFVNQSAVILYHAVSLLLDIGKNTSVRQHVGRRPSWSTCHAQNYPGLPRSYRRPNLSHCKLFGRRNHHDFVEFRFLKKTTVPAVLLATVVTPTEASFRS